MLACERGDVVRAKQQLSHEVLKASVTWTWICAPGENRMRRAGETFRVVKFNEW